jgi:putative Ca2+/H+ antiporter (TMEM165/GDT1 family)
MEAFFVSIGVIALAEIGDKTQLLAFILASRFKQPLPIILGILAATLINHSLAGIAGVWITKLISPNVLRWLLAASFIGMAIWTLIPDEIEENETLLGHKFGVFGATFATFFLAEMGDKTQIATIALTARYNAPVLVIAGTTLGMLLADVPAVYIGNKFAAKIPMNTVHAIAAVIFVLMGLLSLMYQT